MKDLNGNDSSQEISCESQADSTAVVIDGIEVAQNVEEIKVKNLVSSPEEIKQLHDNKCED